MFCEVKNRKIYELSFFVKNVQTRREETFVIVQNNFVTCYTQ